MESSKNSSFRWVTIALCLLSLASARNWQIDEYQAIDIRNSTALDAYVSVLESVYFDLPGAFEARLLGDNVAGRVRTPFGGNLLDSRQTCTGNSANYCFGSSGSSCPDCGICCTSSVGGWCCPATGAICCVGANGAEGCCYSYQTCIVGDGCHNPSVTVTYTSTYYSTVYTTSTYISTGYATSAITSQVFSTAYTTVSDAETATQVLFTTLPSARIRREAQNVPMTKPAQVAKREYDTNPIAQSTLSSTAEDPVVTLLAYPEYDLMARDLEDLGVLVKRQSTYTVSSYAYVTATTTYQVVVTSALIQSVFVTETETSVITSTIYNNARATVTSISTISPTGAVPTGDSQSSTNGTTEDNEGGGGLSTGAKAGIGVGAAAGAALIGVVIFLLWRRHRNNSDQPDELSQPYMVSTSHTNPAQQGPIRQVKPDIPVVAAVPMRQSRSNLDVPRVYSPDPSQATTLPRYPSPQAFGSTSPTTSSVEAQAQGRWSPQNTYQQPPNNGFQYAPFELYNEQRQELYNPGNEQAYRGPRMR